MKTETCVTTNRPDGRRGPPPRFSGPDPEGGGLLPQVPLDCRGQIGGESAQANVLSLEMVPIAHRSSELLAQLLQVDRVQRINGRLGNGGPLVQRRCLPARTVVPAVHGFRHAFQGGPKHEVVPAFVLVPLALGELARQAPVPDRLIRTVNEPSGFGLGQPRVAIRRRLRTHKDSLDQTQFRLEREGTLG